MFIFYFIFFIFSFFIHIRAKFTYFNKDCILQYMQPAEEDKNNFVGMNGENLGLGFINRDVGAKAQEERREIVFKIIKNDQQRQSLKMLIDLKNIFSRQLPKMPKQYIVKLVFDRNHESMVILKDETKVIGGICFRVFQSERFAQIAFLAITSNEQVRGYGTRLMNKLKQEMQRRKIQYLMTYADNLALGYFRKQGFSKDCRMSPERWKGYIKDYEGGTMMECHVHPTIDYSRVSEIIKKQKEFIIQKIKELSLNQVKHDGKQLEKLARTFVKKYGDSEDEVFRIDPMEIPGVIEGGWTWNDHEQLRKTKQVSFQLQCQSIIQMLKKHQSSWPFRQPVSKDDVPDYETIVKDPIDLKTIQMKLSCNEYQSREQFSSDITRMFSNCRLYNQPETVYYKCANDLEDFITTHLNALNDGSFEINIGDNKRPQQKGSRKKTVEKGAK